MDHFSPHKPTRRALLRATTLCAGALGVMLSTGQAWAQFASTPAPAPASANDPRMADRVVGSPTAKVQVDEWYSLTCPHCARFAHDVFPEIEEKLIKTGKLRYVFHEYPLNQVDLMAIMIARAMPADRYEAFVLALLDSQAIWAFDKNRDSRDELAKMAALAGMPRELFDQTLLDDGLKSAILAKQEWAEKAYSIQSTPSFVVNGKTTAGEQTYDEFVKMAGL